MVCLVNRCMREPHVQWCERLSRQLPLAGRATRLSVALLSVRRCVVSSPHTLCPKRFKLEAMSVRVCTVRWGVLIFFVGGEILKFFFWVGEKHTLLQALVVRWH